MKSIQCRVRRELILTGQMGDVMQESARIALTYVRSITSGRKYKVEQEYFDTHSIHLHIPEGAVPKDGPSAGVTNDNGDAFCSDRNSGSCRCCK